MVVSMVQRADGNKRAVTIFEVPKNGEKVHRIIQSTIKVGSAILTDDSKRYTMLERLRYMVIFGSTAVKRNTHMGQTMKFTTTHAKIGTSCNGYGCENAGA